VEKALLMTVKLDYEKRTWDVVELQQELKELAVTAGADVVREELCNRSSATANLYVGEGKAKELANLVQKYDLDMVIFNNDLTGTQHRNLEKVLGVKAVDRTQLILDIFGRRARSPEGKAQVELAQMEYLLPRLSDRGTELSRLGGGIGTRGPGEQKLEEDRRRIREKIIVLKKDLRSLELRRKTLRAKREEVSVPTIALIGYTSAGKSTLFNALTGSEQVISRGLFTTLDPLSRAISLSNNQRVVLSDTVGFIRDLPPHLIEAFKATLEEVVEADLLVHVLDINAVRAKDHYDSVLEVLTDLGAFHKRTVVALNKIDAAPEPARIERLLHDYPNSIAISALRGANLDGLLKKIEENIADFVVEISFVLPHDKMGLVDFIYREGRVEKIAYEADGIHIKAHLPQVTAEKLKKEKIKIK
jgi:GTP-binding protein HflX